MKTLPISIRNKILPLAAAATLTAGALTSCSAPRIDKNTTTITYRSNIEQLGNSHDSFEKHKNAETIDFQNDSYITTENSNNITEETPDNQTTVIIRETSVDTTKQKKNSGKNAWKTIVDIVCGLVFAGLVAGTIASIIDDLKTT